MHYHVYICSQVRFVVRRLYSDYIVSELAIVLDWLLLPWYMYSTNHVYLHRPNAFGFWQTRLHLCYETLKRVSNFSELAKEFETRLASTETAHFSFAYFRKF